jgi:hypothetical protein
MIGRAGKAEPFRKGGGKATNGAGSSDTLARMIRWLE